VKTWLVIAHVLRHLSLATFSLISRRTITEVGVREQRCCISSGVNSWTNSTVAAGVLVAGRVIVTEGACEISVAGAVIIRFLPNPGLLTLASVSAWIGSDARMFMKVAALSYESFVALTSPLATQGLAIPVLTHFMVANVVEHLAEITRVFRGTLAVDTHRRFGVL
jgi:hypothetical protein